MNKLFKMYKNLSKPAKASLWFVMSNVILKGISFFTLPIFSRLLTPSEYGVVSVYSSWVSVISILSTLTIWGGVFNVGMVKYEDKYKKMISAFQGLATSITLVFFVISILFLENVSTILGISELLVICMYIQIIMEIPFNLWSTNQRYKFEYKKIIIITIITAIINPILGIIAVKNTIYKAEARIISTLIIDSIIGLFLFIYNQKEGKVYFNKEFWSFGFKFNIVLIPHYLSMQVLNQSDRIMINSICGSNDVGIYSIAYNFAFLLSLITNGINSSLTPYIYQKIKEKDMNKVKNNVNYIVLLVAVMALGLICFVPDLFTIMLPNSYYPALKVIPPVTLGAFFLFLYPLFGSIEFYYEENKYVTIASIVGAILNIFLNWIFINMFGFIAAAYTTLFCYICFSICHYLFMKKVLKKNNQKNNIYDIKFLILISFCLISIAFIMLLLYDYWYIRWSVIAVILIGIMILRKRIILLLKGLKEK